MKNNYIIKSTSLNSDLIQYVQGISGNCLHNPQTNEVLYKTLIDFTEDINLALNVDKKTIKPIIKYAIKHYKERKFSIINN